MIIGLKILLKCAHCHTDFVASLDSALMLCPECVSEWSRGWSNHNQLNVSGGRALSIDSLRVYEHQARSLIVRAKANRSFGSGKFVADEAAKQPVSIRLTDWAEQIVATSPSLWSRWHGSVNIAQLFAQTLSKSSHTPLMRAPYPLLWRARKSSFRDKDHRAGPLRIESDSYILRQFQSVTSKRVLLVDDVITSGFTMAAVAQFYPNSEIKGLVIARAG